MALASRTTPVTIMVADARGARIARTNELAGTRSTRTWVTRCNGFLPAKGRRPHSTCAGVSFGVTRARMGADVF